VSGVRGRRLTALLAAGLLALAAAACGGNEPLAPQAPGPPADVTIPQSDQAPAEAAGGAGQDAAATGTDQSAPTEPDAGTDGTGTTPETEQTAPTGGDTGAAAPETGGGATAPEAAPDGPTNDTAPPEGSDAQQFEDFCAQNPGAC
jgi:hypothetical protein